MKGIPGDLQWFANAVYYVAFNFSKAVLAFLQRDSYLYWPFLLSTLLVMLVAAHVTARDAREGAWQRFRGYFSRRIWWHRSARADYRLYFANALLLPLVFGWLMFGDAQVARLMDGVFGTAAPAASAAGTGVATRLAYTVVFFLAYDFGRFAAHCLLHDVPALWEFHKVHHSAEVLTPMTAYRAHPVDLLVMAWVPAVTTGAATWLFNLGAGGAVGMYTFLGLHVFLWAVNLIDNLRHSNVWVTYGPVLGRWIVSPAAHQLHHSIEARHLGCNRGFSLAVWDRLYGTLRLPEPQPETFRMGLGEAEELAGRSGWHSVLRMYWRPFAGCAARLRALLRKPAAQ